MPDPRPDGYDSGAWPPRTRTLRRSTSRTASTASIRPGAGSPSRSGRPRRRRSPRSSRTGRSACRSPRTASSVSGRRPTSSLEAHRALRGPPRPGGRRSTARRSPAGSDALLVPRGDASSKYFERDPKRPPRRVVPRRPPYLVVYPFVKLRPWYAALDGGPPARDAGARRDRRGASSRSRTTRRTRSGSTTRSS